MKEFKAQTINLYGKNPEEKRTEILNYFEKTFDTEDKLYSVLKRNETFYLRADPLRHPLIFYYGHTACFFVNKLIPAKVLKERINPEYESIFAIGVDEMSWDDLNEANYNWPSVNNTDKYRKQVRRQVRELIQTLPLDLPLDWKSPFWAILMGIEHIRIHIETSSVLIRQLPLNELKSGVFGKICKDYSEAPQNTLLPVQGGEITLGKPADHRFYGWDLEYGKQKFELENFEASRFLVSNSEFFEFIKNKGYQTDKYWTEEGLAWRNFKKAEHPLFWRKSGKDYKLRLMTEEVKMPWNFPVEINYLEAKAFCNWKSEQTGEEIRMPTEAEWYALVKHTATGDVDEQNRPDANIDLKHFASSCPVDKFHAGEFYDIVGNVWQWTETELLPFPGFKVHPLYDDFSVPTFDSKHNLIKGGSWISTGNESTLHARYAFRRHFYQHAGFRYVKSPNKVDNQQLFYHTEADIARACDQSYGKEYFGLPNFKKKLAEIVKKYSSNNIQKRFLDLNTDSGRTAFELAGEFRHITALDFSARFLKPAIELKEQGVCRYALEDEGEIMHYVDVSSERLGLDKNTERIEFWQADAENLKPVHRDFDTVLCAELLEELHRPRKFLENIFSVMNEDAIFILSSAYNFRKAAEDEKLGGKKVDGEPVYAIGEIDEILSKKFERIEEPFDVEYAKRINSRKFELCKTQVSVWKKK